jgi:predicted NBD/HSP70 family sugar kinase
LSKPTITSVVAFLESEGYVEAVVPPGGEAPAGSRRARLYRFRADLGYILGLDIGGDKLLMLLANLDGEVIARRRVGLKLAVRRGHQEVFDTIRRLADELLADAHLSRDRLHAVAAGTPGIVSPDGVVTLAPQLPNWEGINLRAALGEIFSCPVYVEREVALSLLAEQWLGVAAGIDDALFVNLGVGVGAALLVNGEICRGADGAAGEIGAMPLDAATAPGSNITLGPFESATGGAGLAREGQIAARNGKGKRLLELAGGKRQNIDAAVVWAAARDGDEVAIEIVDRAICTLGLGIACLVCAFNPEAVILGGGMSRAADLMLGPLQAQVALYAPFPPKWLVSTLGEDAVALGALRHANRTLERDLFLSPEATRSFSVSNLDR